MSHNVGFDPIEKLRLILEQFLSLRKIKSLTSAVSLSLFAMIFSANAYADPFTCTGDIYQVQSGQLRIFDTVASTYVDIGTAQGGYNATGYNTVDNYAYGMLGNNVIRIHSDGSIDTVYNVGFGSYAGDVDYGQTYWVRRSASQYSAIDLVTGNVTTVSFSGTTQNAADVAFIEFGGVDYLIAVGGGRAGILDINAASSIRKTIPGLPTSGGFGATWTDSTKRLFTFHNNTGQIFEIFNLFTAAPTAFLVAQGDPSGSNDGFSCNTAPFPNFPPTAIDDDFTTPFNVAVNANVLSDNGNGADSDPENLVLTVNTTLVSGASNGSVTINSLGTFTYTPNPGFFGVDTFDYEVIDASGLTAIATVTITIEKADIEINKTADTSGLSSPVMAGEVINYTITAVNTGNVTLNSVTLNDTVTNQNSDSFPLSTGPNFQSANQGSSVGTLAANETATYTATYVLTQDDVDSGGVSNTVTADAGSSQGPVTDVVDSDVQTPTPPAPSMTLTKTADVSADLELGDVVTYTYAVTNDGNVTMTNVNITDTHSGTGPLSAITPANVAVLAVGDSVNFTATYTVTQADVDSGATISNTAQANATPAGGKFKPVTADETVDPAKANPEITFTKTASVDTGVVADDIIIYTYTAENTGNITLSNVTVTDSHGGSGTLGPITPASYATLTVGQSVNFTASYTVTQADVDTGAAITNTAEVTAKPESGTLPETTATEEVSPVQPAPALTIDKTAITTGFSAVGDVLSYEYIVTNTGTVTIYSVSVSDDKIASVTCPSSDLAPGESITCTADYTVTQADLNAGFVTNNAEAGGKPASGKLTPATDDETVKGKQAPAMTLAKTALDSNFNTVGDILNYEYEVTNTGNVDITALVVSDDKIASVSCPVTVLAPTESTICTASYSVTQADIDAGFVTNNAEADGTPAGGTLDPAVSDATVKGTQKPAMTINKSAVTTDYAAVGDVINYEYLVTNTGNTTITSAISVEDDKIVVPSIVSCPALPAGGLLPGSDITCTAGYMVAQADLDAGSVTNIASATDGTTTSKPDTETVDATQSPAMTLVKTPIETSYTAVGDTISYTYTVTNTGNVLIADLEVTDNLISAITCNVSAVGNGDVNLDPTEEVVCTGTYTVTQADLDAGSVTNTASATGTPPGGTLTPPETDATVDADQQPALTLAKTAGEASFDTVGDILTYEYRVENTGNVLVSAITVSDDKIASVTCDVAAIGNNDANLDPTEVVICTASYTVTQADIDAGFVTNNAAASGTPAGGTLDDALDDASVDADQSPALSVEKTATDVQFTAPGDITTYEYVVTNSGNTTITAPITVNDNLVTVTCPALPAGGLAPTQTLTCTSSYVVTQADLDAGSVTNIAAATDGTTTSPQDSETIPATQDPSLLIVKRALSAEYTTAGEVVTYEYDVTNTGNLTLTGGVNVVDDKIGTISCVIGNFVPGDMQTCSATYTITQADIDDGSVTNQAYAQNGSLVSVPVDVTVDADQNPGLSFDKRETAGTYTNAGDVLSYEFDVENTGNVTLIGVVVTDTLVSVSCPSTILIPAETMLCTASYTVTQADVDAGSVTNNASISGTPPSGPSVEEDDSVTTDSDPMPSMAFEKRALNANISAAGEIINYEFDVENTGSVTLNNIVITDDLVASVSCPLTTLAPAASMVCTASYTVTQADVDAGFVENNASAGAELPDGTDLPPVPSSDTVDAIPAPSMTVNKVAVDTDYTAVGDVLNYTYTVTNTGNVTISAISVSDDLIALVSCPATVLAPAADMVCTASYTVTQADIDAGSVTNIATTDGTPAGGTLDPATDTETVDGTQTPSLETVKTAMTADYDAVGDTISYEYVITNTGNTTIIDPITVSDDRIPSVSCPALPSGGLVPAGTLTCTAIYVVTQSDIDAGSITNVASSTDGTTTSPDVSETVDGVQTPEMAMTKTASPQIYAAVGDTITYSYVVTNTGNVTLTSAVTVSDDKIVAPSSVNCPALPMGGLAPNASLTCTATSTVTQLDLDNGSLTNTASASDGTTSTPDVSETVSADQMPALGIEKNALTADFAAVGDRVDYEYIVTNTGNVTITNTITVSDDKIAAVSCPVLAGGLLAPGATTVCTASYYVTQADIDAGSVTNTASSSAGGTTSPTVDETVDAVQEPALTVSKSALVMTYDTPGDVLMYEYLVRNSGNTTLTGSIMVNDDRIAAVSCPSLPMSGLAPNDTITCSASYVVTQADIDAGSVTNTASATDGTVTSPEDDVTVDADQEPMLTTLKTALSSTFQTVGEVIDYEFEVINSGNTTITSPITVSDNRIASVTCPALPAGGLLPSASVTCTGSDSVTQADIDAGVIENIASATDGDTTSDPVTERVVATRIDGLEVEKTATDVNFNLPGDLVTYEYVVTNTGNATITDPISVNDNLISNVICPALPAGGLAPTATLTCTGIYVVTQDNLDVGSVTNIASATDGTTTSGLASETIPANTDPALNVQKTSSDTSFNMAGQILTYDYRIENTGNVTLTNDTFITDNKIGTFVCYTGNFIPAQVETCQATYTVTQVDVDAGFVTNDAYATHQRANSDPDFVTVPADKMPELSLVKNALTSDYDSVGDVLSYEYIVTNSGNTTITFAVSVSDDQIASVSCPSLPAGGLAPGASLTCTATDTVTQADIDAGSITNAATATDGFTSTDPETQTVDAIQTSGISIDKIANNSDFNAVGDVLSYSYIVTNTGNVTITSAITVSDDQIASVSCGALPSGGLAPGGTIGCTGSDVITQADLDTGSVTNIASASDGTTTSDPDSETVTGTQTPEMAITKTPVETSFNTAGDVLNYVYTVANTGNVTLTSAITVSDDLIPSISCPALPAGGLLPGNSIDCTASYVVTQADVDAGSVTNIASASDGINDTPDTSATVNGEQTPSMSLDKTSDLTSFDTPGQVVTYTYVVTNTGNVTITNAVTINDDQIASVSCPALPLGGLLPAATLTCTATDTITQAHIDAGFVTNTASATDGSTTSNPDTETVMANQTNDFTITKVARNNDYAVIGDVLSYEYIVTNTGNVSIVAPISVTDDLIATVNCPALPAGGLVPMATLTCVADYTVTQDDLNAGSVTNIAFATSDGESSAPDEVTVTGTQEPSMTIEKSAAVSTYSNVGDIVGFIYVVTNTGNVAITNAITVTDDKIPSVTCPALPAGGLVPSETLTCAGGYAVTQADLDAGSVTNIAFASDGTTNSDTDEVTVTAEQAPALSVDKSAQTGTFVVPGDIVSYSYVVTNTGNVTVTDPITVSDDKIPSVSCPALPASGFAPGATLTCIGDYPVTQIDIDAGEVTNIASATDGTTVSDTDTVTVNADSMPRLAVTKSVVDLIQVGGPIYDVVYQITATNTGNVSLTDVQIEDDLATILAPTTIYQTPVAAISGFTGGSVNAAYDGVSDIDLLSGSPVLPVGDMGVITISLRIDTTNGGPAMGNTAVGSSDVLADPVPSNDPNVTPDNNDDTNPTPLDITDTDGDGAPDDLESNTDDRDGDGIPDSEDYDPTGYFFCEENGQILTGGGISIAGPSGLNSAIGSANDITIVRDGSDGYYQFFVTAAGRYTITPTYPTSGVASTDRPVQNVSLDVTTLLPSNPGVLGSSEVGATGELADYTAPTNSPFYFEFDFEAGDPVVLMNNIPLKNCGSPEIKLTKVILGDPVTQPDGQQTLTYSLTAENTGETIVEDVQISDDLGSVYGPTRVKVDAIDISNKPVGFGGNEKPSFDGISDVDMMTNIGDLKPGEEVTVEIQVTVNPEDAGDYVNTASVTASEPLNGKPLMDADTAVINLAPTSDASLLRVEKTAQPRTVQIGDPILYTVSVTNEGASTMTDLRITDQLPSGFSYIPNTSVLSKATGDLTLEPDVPGSGTLTWTVDSLQAAPFNVLQAGETMTVSLRLLAGPNVKFGAHENQAYVESLRTGSRSDTAIAVVDYVPEPTFDCTPVIGRVYDDVNHNGYPDDGEPGLPAVKLATVNGDIITTDQYGRYHIPCAILADSEKGSNFLLKADVRTLPLGYLPTSENPRVVRATRGKFVKMNFGAAHRTKLRMDFYAADFVAGKVTPKAQTRMRSLLETNDLVERAILVYHADESEHVDTAQAALAAALKFVKSNKPKELNDIALEATWGGTDEYISDAEDRPRGEYYERPEGFTATHAHNDNYRSSTRYEGDNLRREASATDHRGYNKYPSLRGSENAQGFSGDTRPAGIDGGRRARGDEQTARPGRLQRWVGWGNKTSAYADGLEIETKVTALDVVKNLDAVAGVVMTSKGRAIEAKSYWNYSAFIEKAELRFFDADKSTRGTPAAVLDMNLGEGRLPLSGPMPTEMVYVLRVYNAEGDFDETYPKALSIGEPEADFTPQEWMQESDMSFGEDTISMSNIIVKGGTVQIYGRNIPGQSVRVMGRDVTVDQNGLFVAEELLPKGMQSLDIRLSTAGTEESKIMRMVDVKTRDHFFVGQIEATIGESIENSAKGDRAYEEGRAAFYLRSRLNELWSLTATADTGEAEIEDLFDGLNDKDVGQLLRRLDPDRYYPTYGDDSTIEQDAPTSGRFYARIERLDDYALWGNYRTDFNDTEYARVQRTLYGAKMHWDQNGDPTRYGDDRTSLTAYIAGGGSRQGRDELRGTGGSVYYMRHGDISIGSETLRMETRDAVSGIVIESRRLTYGSDYEMDFIQGRILLNQPFGSTADDGRLFSDGSQSGNQQILVIDYEYSPIAGSSDALVYGVRGTRWIGDNLKIGATYNHDTDGGTESDLIEADATYQFTAGSYIKGEIAQSKGVGVETYRSIDGGFNYTALPRGGLLNNDKAMAYALEAAADFNDIDGFKLDGNAYAYWRLREAGFAGYAHAANNDVTQYGGGFNIGLMENLGINGRADITDEQFSGTNSYGEVSAEYNVDDRISVRGGVAFSEDQTGTSGTSVGVRAEYKLSDRNMLYVFGQAGISGDNTRTTDRVGAGAELAVNDRISAGGEVSTGEDGLGARASVRYTRDDNSEYYLGYDLPLASAVNTNRGTMNLGARRRYTDALSIYGEERFVLGTSGLDGITHAYGIDYKPGDWNLSASAEVGRVEDLKRAAFSASAGFSGERLSAGLQGEYRTDENVLTGDTRNTWLMRSTAQYRPNEELRVQGKFNYAFSDQASSLGPVDFNQAKFMEASLSAAYRPIWDDRFNMLAKLVYLNDLSPSAQRFNGETLNYRQRSQIISIDGSYDLTSRWTLGAKYGHRSGEVTTSRASSSFAKSSADLGVIRLDYHATHNWDATLEGRYLNIGNGTITRKGGLAGIYRHMNDNVKIGGGVVWGGVEEEYLAAKDKGDIGWFLNVVGKF